MSEAVAFELETCQRISDLPKHIWEQFAGRDNPFLRYEFFQSLEESGCTTADTGWQPSHLIVREGEDVVGVAPAYLKYHSMGEYVFDWAWADAYQRYGVPYYPKLLIAVPFTPSRGPRLMMADHVRNALAPPALSSGLDTLCEEIGAHSWHLLFPDEADQALLHEPEELHRIGCQFHWHNRDYRHFDDFLATLTSRKRKSIRRERRQVAEQGITFRRFSGQGLPDTILSAFYVFYQATYLKRGQRPYLNKRFFQLLRDRLPEHLEIVMAVKEDRMIAGALFLTGGDTLYGRYWGCLDEFDHLHFETCYYQGIEMAIELGLTRFDAGAQGEHKLVRGFEPTLTHSWHGILHEGFREPIREFTLEEAAQVRAYLREAETLLPYRQQAPD